MFSTDFDHADFRIHGTIHFASATSETPRAKRLKIPPRLSRFRAPPPPGAAAGRAPIQRAQRRSCRSTGISRSILKILCLFSIIKQILGIYHHAGINRIYRK